MNSDDKVTAVDSMTSMEQGELIEKKVQEEADANMAMKMMENDQDLMEESRRRMEEIEEEVRQTQPLASPKEVIATLVDNYDKDTSPEYHQKALDLANTYTHIRKIRGDGNCFYRSVLTAQVERVFNNEEELAKFTDIVKKWRRRLLRCDFPKDTTEDFCDSMNNLLSSIHKKEKSLDMLFDDLNQDQIANYYVAFMRLITSGFLRENKELYSAFIEGDRTVEQYCLEEIDPMWKESDQIAAVALANAIDVPVRIEYMDRTEGAYHHDLIPLTMNSAEPQLYFLYRPGHYDILYKN